MLGNDEQTVVDRQNVVRRSENNLRREKFDLREIVAERKDSVVSIVTNEQTSTRSIERQTQRTREFVEKLTSLADRKKKVSLIGKYLNSIVAPI